MQSLRDPARRPFFGGVALATPFIVFALPSSLMYLALLATLPLAINLASDKFPRLCAKTVPGILWIALLLAFLHLLGLHIGKTPHWRGVLAGLVFTAALSVIFLSSSAGPKFRLETMSGFFAALLPVATMMAIVGLLKGALLERGVLIASIFSRELTDYPNGSSLRADYNLFGLSMLVAAIGWVLAMHRQSLKGRPVAAFALALAIVLAAGILAGSRRFLLVSAVIPMFWLILSWLELPRASLLRSLGLPMLGVLLFIASLNWAMSASTKADEYLVIDSQSLVNVGKAPETAGGDPPLTRRTVIAKSVVVKDAALDQMWAGLFLGKFAGFESRVPRWFLGWQLLDSLGWVKGIGFAYHEVFACKFLTCDELDYPHMPIMSEWLVGGIVGGLAAVAFYVLLLSYIWRSGRGGWVSGSTPLVIAVLPYSLISGDTLFAIPQLMVAGLLAYNDAGLAAKPRVA